MGSFADELSRFITPQPVFQDPEDDQNDVTTARLVARGHSEYVAVPASSLRRKVNTVPTQEEGKYGGRQTTRSKLNKQGIIQEGDQSSEDDQIKNDDDIDDEEDDVIQYEKEEALDDGDEDDSIEEDEDEDLANFRSNFKKSADYEDSGDFGSLDDDDDDDDDDIDDDDNLHVEANELEESEEGPGIESFSRSDLQGEVQKGHAAKQQLGLWDSLLESRIKFQKAITLINQLPQCDTWSYNVEKGEEKLQQEMQKAQTGLKELLDKLVQLQTILFLQHSETRNLVTGQKREGNSNIKEDDDDEEITSESDEGEEVRADSGRDSTAGHTVRRSKRKLPMGEYPDFLAKRHAAFTEYRNDTLQKWYDKTKLSSGQVKNKSFGSFELSALRQIEQILSDKERLVKRTQTRRSNYRVFGKKDAEVSEERTDTADTDMMIVTDPDRACDTEIFDDSDFYHQQLRELIERRTSSISDPIALSRQWLEIQKLRSKVKKKVDTKASKGRKIRYNIHKKLVNFMAPREMCTWTDEARDDLFKSLFGAQTRFSSSNDTSR